MSTQERIKGLQASALKGSLSAIQQLEDLVASHQVACTDIKDTIFAIDNVYGPSASDEDGTRPSAERVAAIISCLSMLAYGFGEKDIFDTNPGVDFVVHAWPLVRDWSAWLIDCTQITPSSTASAPSSPSSYPEVVETIERAFAAALAQHALVIDARKQHDAKTITAFNSIIRLWCYCSADKKIHSPHRLVTILGYWLAPRTAYPTINGRIPLTVVDEMVATIRALPYDTFARAMAAAYTRIEQDGFSDIEHITGFLSLLNMTTLGNIMTLAARGFCRWHTNILRKLTSRRSFSTANTEHLAGVIRACIGDLNNHLKSRGSTYVTHALRTGALLALVQAGVLLKSVVKEQEVANALNVLRPYILWPSHRRDILKQLRSADKTGLRAQLSQTSPVSRALVELERLALDFSDSVRIKDVCIGVCANCDAPRGQFHPRRCKGCLHTVYCSESCQRDHWKKGHSMYCMSAFQLLDINLVKGLGMNRTDSDFLLYLAARDVQRSGERIAACFAKEASAVRPGELPMLVMDYGQYVEDRNVKMHIVPFQGVNERYNGQLEAPKEPAWMVFLERTKNFCTATKDRPVVILGTSMGAGGTYFRLATLSALMGFTYEKVDGKKGLYNPALPWHRTMHYAHSLRH
ncbi:hypothetical protein CYLTODRAFT_491142 [Cylindrobasidium torrendii FP15055 ss-10]|uniref:MYND-type domain-containing protein n=1 Tax=Cylindrobasidium torrendii FP15055 ss-10 TaxID=1314674 RepID=A0A0D7B9G8_9AGAR|nr:hypothetical protein CYLTODRAFT_491142 [Cylindrobasidium torrendii FP15055 ss-10]